MAEYSDFANVFLINQAIELSKSSGIKGYAIKLVERKQPLYEPIYILNLVELDTLKIYIKIYLKTVFIWLSKFPANALILCNKKFDDSFCLYIN